MEEVSLNINVSLDINSDIEIEAGNYFVSFIDILGFGERINNKPFPILEKTHLSLYRLLWGISEAHRTGKSNIFYHFYQPFPEIPYFNQILKNNTYNFSDSIIFYIKASKDDEENQKRFSSLCQITNIFIAKSIIQDPRLFEFPLRAAIAYGPTIIDRTNKIHMGQPIIDAYELTENQNWMGGAIHHDLKTGLSVPDKFIQPLVGYDNEIIRYKEVPIVERKTKKNYYKEMFVLNWVRQHPNHSQIRAGNWRPTYDDIGKEHVEKHDWGKETKKCEETMKFVKFICDQFENK